MSKITKCDRCGKIFDDVESQDVKGREYLICSCNYDICIDLCARCYRDLYTFLNCPPIGARKESEKYGY